VYARVTTFEEINLVLYPDNVKVQSYADAYNVRRSVIGYSHIWPYLVLSWIGGRGTIGRS